MTLNQTAFRSLSSLTQLAMLSILTYSEDIPVSIIPSSVKTLEIRMTGVFGREMVTIPDTIESLKLSGYQMTRVNTLPTSITKLVLDKPSLFNMSVPITLPSNVQEFTFILGYIHLDVKYIEFLYPPNLRFIDFSHQGVPYKPTNIPTSVSEFKYQVLNILVHSVGDDDGLIFLSTLKKLSVHMDIVRGIDRCWVLQLNYVINQTSVETLVIEAFHFQVDIRRRLDGQNRNVLIVGKSLNGGIMHQQIVQRIEEMKKISLF
ncbi:hypothetical protein DFA_02066 [Cavenderia fasciculata]|uniref:Uncharacterized protein n=1 Tax=Cavenderia fasciculata TaxID=261658 RepID=F4PYL3_CACFS|nr:uncharacterized protein DFA_02066 [Cavenderia fasciculata]EGG19279.1 hypothetical protein DFA_02066 [Cavenderia fasciculata]|eukprot:XP_004357550.1 hypothetical protein DFA_02066 [Cavenderia fasciculata]